MDSIRGFEVLLDSGCKGIVLTEVGVSLNSQIFHLIPNIGHRQNRSWNPMLDCIHMYLISMSQFVPNYPMMKIISDMMFYWTLYPEANFHKTVQTIYMKATFDSTFWTNRRWHNTGIILKSKCSENITYWIWDHIVQSNLMIYL